MKLSYSANIWWFLITDQCSSSSSIKSWIEECRRRRSDMTPSENIQSTTIKESKNIPIVIFDATSMEVYFPGEANVMQNGK